MDANPANTALDHNLTGLSMATIRSANRRHQRAIVSTNARRKVAGIVTPPKAKPVKATA